MNIHLCQPMSQYFTPEQQARDIDRDVKLRKELPSFFKKHNAQWHRDQVCQ